MARHRVAPLHRDEISFRVPYKGNVEALVMTPKGETIWGDWNRPEAHVVCALKDRLRMDKAYRSLLEGCAHPWTKIRLLIDILRCNCGLDSRFVGFEVVAEDFERGELCGPSKAMSHESVISDIEQLLPLL